MNHHQRTLARQPRLGTGFAESEWKWITRRLAPLATRLRAFSNTAVELDLSVKDRDGADPRVTLVCRISGESRLVATAAGQTLETAMIEVRNDMIRQIESAKANKTWRKPRNAHLTRRHRSGDGVRPSELRTRG
jgi:hypothetical protein